MNWLTTPAFMCIGMWGGRAEAENLTGVPSAQARLFRAQS